MVRRTKIDVGVSVCVLLLGASAARAQQIPPIKSTADAPVDELQEISVTGIRASLEAAQDIKREAPSVVEAITLEDLGKFTDSSITDALQRLPGVNIDTNAIIGYGGASSVAIRGLGADYSSSTLNGRNALGTSGFFGARARQFDFNAIPPDVLAGVTVYKTSTSELIEPGMAGQVDLRTLRPLDYAGKKNRDYFGSISAAGTRSEGAGKFGEKVNGIIGGKFLDGTLGVYVSAVWSNEYVHRSELQTYNDRYSFGVQDSSGNVKQYKDVWSTWGTDSWVPDYKFTKLSTSGALQWKPNENLDVNLDFIRNHYEQKESTQSDYFQNTGIFSLSPASIAQPGSAVVGGLAVPGVTDGGLLYFDTRGISNISSPGSANSGSASYAAPFQDFQDFHYFEGGLNAAWTSDGERFKLIGDIAHSDNQYFANWLRPYLGNGIGGESALDFRGGGIPLYSFFNVPATDVSNPGSYDAYGFVEHFNKQASNTRNTYRLDFAVRFTDSLLGKIGINHEVSGYRFVSMNFDPLTFPSVVPGNFFVAGSTALPAWPVPLPNGSIANFCAANTLFCSQSNRNVGSLGGGFPRNPSTAGGSGQPFVPATPGDTFDLNTTESYELKEQNTALYTQLDFKGDLFQGMTYSGNVGVRAVRIQEDGVGYQGVVQIIGFTSGGVVSSQVIPVEERNSYWRYLPSLNVSVNLRPNMALRFGASKTISLAQPGQLAPTGTVNIILPDSGGFAQPSVANTNNTFLKPTAAKNYDLTGEYYTSYGGAYIASVFYKDVSDLIQNVVQTNVTIPGQGSRLFVLTTAINGASGRVRGFELGTNQPFKFLPSPWDGFGVATNYTYVDTSTNVNNYATRFIGSSKNNLNVNAYFEKYRWAARIAYSYRSSYVVDFSNGVDVARPERHLDASLSKQIGQNLEVILTGSNLAKANLTFDSEQGGFLTTNIERPRSYAVAVRASF